MGFELSALRERFQLLVICFQEATLRRKLCSSAFYHQCTACKSELSVNR
jgi:hypothetical protein